MIFMFLQLEIVNNLLLLRNSSFFYSLALSLQSMGFASNLEAKLYKGHCTI